MKVPGDVEAIRELAGWFGDLDSASAEADGELISLRSDTSQYWTGASASAFQDAISAVRDGLEALVPYLTEAGEVFRAYANRLERGQGDFDNVRDQAQRAGLKIYYSSVLTPTTSIYFAAGDTVPEKDREDWELYLGKVYAYNLVLQYVDDWLEALDVWLADHMAPLVVQVEKFSAYGSILNALMVDNDDVTVLGIESHDAFVEGYLATVITEATAKQTAADLHAKNLRSGNPARKAAALADEPNGLRKDLALLNKKIAKFVPFAKGIPIVGGAVEIISAGVEVQQGGSVSSVGVEFGAGAAGGALVGGLLSGGPIGLAIAAAAVASVVAGAGGRWMYEAWVPLDAREAIDDFFITETPTIFIPDPSYYGDLTR